MSDDIIINLDQGGDTTTIIDFNGYQVRSVNGRNGDVVLTQFDVGLSAVDNTSDLNKPISIATLSAINIVNNHLNSYIQSNSASEIQQQNATNFVIANSANIKSVYTYVNRNSGIEATQQAATSFVVVNSSKILSNYSTVNSQSARGVSVYSNVNLLSAEWSSVYSDINLLSGNWESVYSNNNNLSSNWESVYSNINDLSSNWQSVYSNVNLISSDWNSVYSNNNNLSSNWESVYSDVNSLSSNWESVYSDINELSSYWSTLYSDLSSNWESVYSDVNFLSSNWESVYSDVNSLSSDWESVYSDVNLISADWESVYSDVNDLSSNWESVYSDVNLISADWQSVYSDVKFLSSNWESVYSDVNSLSSDWNSVYNNISGLSANWESVYSTFNSQSSNNDSVYSTYNQNSSTYSTLDYVDSTFLPLSGGTVTGDTFFNSNVTIYGTLSSSANDTCFKSITIGQQYNCYKLPTTDSSLYNASIITNGNGISTWQAQPYKLDNNNNVIRPNLGNTAVGYNNTISGYGNTVSGQYSTASGYYNTISGNYSTILNGYNNKLVANNSYILGSNIDAKTNNTTFVNNLSTTGNITANKFYGDGSNLKNVKLPYSNVNILSSNWESVYSDVNDLSSNWESVYSTFNSQSANNDSVYSDVNTLSSNWESAYSDVNTLSSNWESAYSDVNTLSSNWESVYSIYNTNSTNYVNNNFLPLSGGTIDGILSTTNIANFGSDTVVVNLTNPWEIGGNLTVANTIYITSKDPENYYDGVNMFFGDAGIFRATGLKASQEYRNFLVAANTTTPNGADNTKISFTEAAPTVQFRADPVGYGARNGIHIGNNNSAENEYNVLNNFIFVDMQYPEDPSYGTIKIGNNLNLNKQNYTPVPDGYRLQINDGGIHVDSIGNGYWSISDNGVNVGAGAIRGASVTGDTEEWNIGTHGNAVFKSLEIGDNSSTYINLESNGAASFANNTAGFNALGNLFASNLSQLIPLTSISGTKNQIDVSVIDQNITLSLPSSAVFSGDVVINGTLLSNGSATFINTNNLIIDDNIIYINNANDSNTLDTGIVSHFKPVGGYYNHTGFIRKSNQNVPGIWTLFSGLTTEPISSTNINWNDATLCVDYLSANLIGNVYGYGDETVLSNNTNLLGHGNGTLTINYTNGIYVDSPITYNYVTSDNWNTAYQIVSGGVTVSIPTSGNWNDAYTTLTSTSGNWDFAYTTLTLKSSDWDNTYTFLKAATANTFNVNNLFAVGSLSANTLSANNLNVNSNLNINSNYIYGTSNETVLSDGNNLTGKGGGTLSLNYTNGVYLNSNLYLSSANLPTSIYMYDPSGIRWRLTVTTSGALSTVKA
jgi:archaellum component FlaC